VAARIDTGFLDRLLATRPASASATDRLAEVAAVSAALFAAIAPQKNGQNGATKAGNGKRPDNPAWKRAARSEGVRDK
jgi:hypothetical protein